LLTHLLGFLNFFCLISCQEIENWNLKCSVLSGFRENRKTRFV
jgi:hypothetical protein